MISQLLELLREALEIRADFQEEDPVFAEFWGLLNQDQRALMKFVGEQAKGGQGVLKDPILAATGMEFGEFKREYAKIVRRWHKATRDIPGHVENKWPWRLNSWSRGGLAVDPKFVRFLLKQEIGW